jgi:NodT family efflux transporter outer membrane factor (OMF) lipoprotein
MSKFVLPSKLVSHPLGRPPKWIVLVSLLSLVLSGCTSLRDYVHNGLKVGPNYHKPPALVADHWIDAADKRVRSETDSLCTWWRVMNDPVLNQLMISAYQQNLTLREAGFRVLEARAQLGIAMGNFFPQTQNANGSYRRINSFGNFFEQWNFGFNLAWELDFWGRFRRAIQSAEDSLDSSVFNYDDVLVTLLGDVASNYVTIRTTQERIRLLESTVLIQQDVYNFISERLKIGFRGITTLDQAQAESNLKQSQAQLAQFRIDIRQAENRLCTLLGIPTVDLEAMLNAAAANTQIPTVPDYVVVGMPADLLRRRPDVRRAERNAAAQAELIGIAEAALYPVFTINGSLAWQATKFSNLFEPSSFNGSVGPSFQWNLLNYGRILNNMRFQDATFQELVATYQETVLEADEEVEDGIVNFLQSQERSRLLKESVDAGNIALQVIIAQYQNAVQGLGPVDFNRYAVIQQNLIVQQDQWAQARGQVDQGLIQVYRALGGGWQIRRHPNPEELRVLPPCPIEPATPPEQVPAPNPEVPAPNGAVPAPNREVPAPNPLDNPAANPPGLNPRGATILTPNKVAPASFFEPLKLNLDSGAAASIPSAGAHVPAAAQPPAPQPASTAGTPAILVVTGATPLVAPSSMGATAALLPAATNAPAAGIPGIDSPIALTPAITPPQIGTR